MFFKYYIIEFFTIYVFINIVLACSLFNIIFCILKIRIFFRITREYYNSSKHILYEIVRSCTYIIRDLSFRLFRYVVVNKDSIPRCNQLVEWIFYATINYTDHANNYTSNLINSIINLPIRFRFALEI